MTDGEHFTIEAARQAARRDELGPWVARFLASPGSDNAALAETLCGPSRTWIGPVRLPLRQLHRLAGPADHPVLCPVDEDEWRDDVEDLGAKVDNGFQPPPVVVSLKGDHLMLEDGNHRVEALRRAGEDAAWAVVSFKSTDERDGFIGRAGDLTGDL